MESHPRSGVRVNADAHIHRRLAGASHKSARPPNVSLLNSLNHPPLSQSQQPPHISSTAQPSSSKTPQLATFNKPRLRSSHRNLPKVSTPCYFVCVRFCYLLCRHAIRVILATLSVFWMINLAFNILVR